MPGLEDVERLIAGLGAQRRARRHGRDQPHPHALMCPRPDPPFGELARLSPMNTADEIREERGRRLRNP
jgi:hypothetical protein